MTFTPPTPKPGKRSVLFKYPGRRKWSVNVVLPNGHTEVIPEEKLNSTDLNVARARAMHIITRLQREFGIESQTQKDRRESGAVVPRRGRPRKVPRIADEIADEIADDAAPRSAASMNDAMNPILRRYVHGFRQIEELVIMGANNDPARFAQTVTAIVLQSLMGRGKRLFEPG